MPALQVNHAIMFADIAGSSRLFHEAGNNVASARINETLSALHERASVFGGELVKTIGDEIMLKFATADSAAMAAREMQRYLHQQTLPLKLKIGASFGATLVKSSDVFGEAVNDAACVARIAKGDQIIVTSTFYEALSYTQQQYCQVFDRTLLKGKNQHNLIYRMDLDNPLGHCTQVLPVIHLTTEHDSLPEIQLNINGEQLSLSVADLPYRFGRDRHHVDCFVPSALASRQHCELLFRRRKFVLVDHSTNGTFVHQEHTNEVYLRREEAPLQGRGRITFGEPSAAAKGPVIHFVVQ